MGHKPLTSHSHSPFSQPGLESQLEDQAFHLLSRASFSYL